VNPFIAHKSRSVYYDINNLYYNSFIVQSDYECKELDICTE